MALTYIQQAEKVTSAEFLARVRQATVEAGLSVMGEATDYPGHTERAALAQRALQSDINWIGRGVLTNPNCGTGTADPLEDDDALLFVVLDHWDKFAGYGTKA